MLFRSDYEHQIVNTNRTELLDLATKALLDKKAHVRADFLHAVNGKFTKQMCVPARITDAGGRPVWTKGEDHFFHSAAYRYLAFLVSGMRNSIASNAGWHSSTATERQTEPQVHIIGEIIDPKTSKTKRRGWSV